MHGVGKQRRRYGDSGTAVYLVEYVGEWLARVIVGYKLEREGYDVPVEQHLECFALLLAHMEERQQQGASLEPAGIGGRQCRKAYHYVGRKSLGASHDLDPAAAVRGIGIVYVGGSAALHLYPEATSHEHSRSFGGKRETVFEHALRCREAYHGAALGGCGAQQFFQGYRCVHLKKWFMKFSAESAISPSVSRRELSNTASAMP